MVIDELQPARTAARHDVPLWRLYVLRVTYLLLAVGMGSRIWPLIVDHQPWELMQGVALCMLAAMTALAAVGIRYPLQMLPLLFFELFWKTLWLFVVALPMWQANQPMDATMLQFFQANLTGSVLFTLAIPSSFVLDHYVRKGGDRWR